MPGRPMKRVNRDIFSQFVKVHQHLHHKAVSASTFSAMQYVENGAVVAQAIYPSIGRIRRYQIRQSYYDSWIEAREALYKQQAQFEGEHGDGS